MFRRPVIGLLTAVLLVSAFTPAQAEDPNDPLFAQQQNLRDINWVNLPGALDAGGLVGVVLDTGFDTEHREFSRFVEQSPIQPVNRAPCDGTDVHGTTVMGVMAADTGNSIGGAGVAEFATLWPIEMRPRLADCGAIADDWPEVLIGLADLPEDDRPDVVNLSFGTTFTNEEAARNADTGPSFELVERAVRYATNHGIVVVASAGNGGVQQDEERLEDVFSTPASHDSVIAVAATITGTDQRHPNSVRGIPDLAAPSTDLIVPLRGSSRDAAVLAEGNTSHAAPHVSGLALALAGARRSAHDGTTLPWAIRNIMEQTARLPSRPGAANELGHGIIDFERAIHDPVIRLSGADRYETALLIQRHASSYGSERLAGTIIVVPTSHPEDWRYALPAIGMASLPDVTVVAGHTDIVHGPLLDELQRISPIYATQPHPDPAQVLLPGSDAISFAPNMAQAIEQYGYRTQHLGGQTPESAAVAVARSAIAARGFSPTNVLMVNVDAFPDAIAMSAVSVREGWPLLFMSRNSVDPETCDLLETIDPVNVFVAGGPVVASDLGIARVATCSGLQPAAVEDDRVAGATRVETSVGIARKFGSISALRALGYSIALATGRNWVDAVSGGLLGIPILLTTSDGINDTSGQTILEAPIKAFLAEDPDRYREALILGGPVAVGFGAEEDLRATMNRVSPCGPVDPCVNFNGARPDDR